MEKSICSKVLRSGKRCTKTAKYGNYCKIHMSLCEGLPLLALPEELILKIVQYLNDPKDFLNLALVSPRIKFIVACHLEKMIKYVLPRFVEQYYNRFIENDYSIGLTKHFILEEKRWNYILFLAIGGLYINDFKKAGKNFKLYSDEIPSEYKVVNVEWKGYSDKTCSSIKGSPLLLCIKIKEITPTSSYYSVFKTTDFDKLEQFFWRQLIL